MNQPCPFVPLTLPGSVAVVFAGIVSELTCVGPGELSCTVTGVSFVVTVTLTGPERPTLNAYQSTSFAQMRADKDWPEEIVFAVADVSFGSNASVHATIGSPALAKPVTKTYVCGDFTGTLFPTMTAR